MRLSTSSSNDRLPDGNWIILWMVVCFVSVLFIVFFEVKLRQLGWLPSVVDSKQLWSEQRSRASELGEQAIIFVGASRAQLDIDMQVVKNTTKLEPVQLAIDGAPFMAVLENLADDPKIKGTIIVSVTVPKVNPGNNNLRDKEWVDYYQEIASTGYTPYRVIHNWIKILLDQNMVTRLQGARPYTIISNLAFQSATLGNYLITQRNRSKDADHAKVQMPHFYAARLQRHYGRNLADHAKSFSEFFEKYREAILKIKPVDNKTFLLGLDLLLRQIQKIEQRGGKVFLVRYPSDKLIWEIDNRSYPMDHFWREIHKKHERSFHFMDYQSLSKFDLPDGSHLDYRDKSEFTLALMKIICNYSAHLDFCNE